MKRYLLWVQWFSIRISISHFCNNGNRNCNWCLARVRGNHHAVLLLLFTLTMDPVHAIAVLVTIYVSATFAGSITAILINTPGTSAAAATTFDGFPLAQRGEAGRVSGHSCDCIDFWRYSFSLSFYASRLLTLLGSPMNLGLLNILLLRFLVYLCWLALVLEVL